MPCTLAGLASTLLPSAADNSVDKMSSRACFTPGPPFHSSVFPCFIILFGVSEDWRKSEVWREDLASGINNGGFHCALKKSDFLSSRPTTSLETPPWSRNFRLEIQRNVKNFINHLVSFYVSPKNCFDNTVQHLPVRMLLRFKLPHNVGLSAGNGWRCQPQQKAFFSTCYWNTGN